MSGVLERGEVTLLIIVDVDSVVFVLETIDSARCAV